MKGWHIFLHSLLQVTGNLTGAIKVSALPFLIQFITMGLVFGFGSSAFDPTTMMQEGGPGAGFWLGAAFALVVAIFTSLWIAVAWHRFVLLGEDAPGYVPSLKTDLLWAYFVRTLGVMLVCIGAGFCLGIVGGFLGVMLGAVGGPIMTMIIMAVVVYIPVFIVSFRVSGSLPGAALGNEVDFWASWNATKTANLDMLILAIISIVVNVALGVLGMIPVIGIALSFMGGWMALMVGVSVLTTIYGHYIEGRDLTTIKEPPNVFE